MKLIWVLFGLLLAMCLVVAALFVIDEIPAGRTAGYAHDQFPVMDQGGPGQLRHAPILWLAWGFAMLETAFLVLCLALGTSSDRRGELMTPLAIGGLLLAGVVTMMFLSYQRYMVEGGPALFFGFPATTAWYLYGFWPVQLFFVVLYVIAFSRLIVGAGDREAFDAIVEAKRSGDAARSR